MLNKVLNRLLQKGKVKSKKRGRKCARGEKGTSSSITKLLKNVTNSHYYGQVIQELKEHV